ncbi:hypothetical protein [Parashewanella tropica]|uniref:hypothetical protein n=1 Tax=Parashewanella tropica TaxID=2547970 RepID=UPI001059811E|nr:hypothetical protein [Parashewanella tropica]
MKLWTLEVLNPNSADWEASTHKGAIIVRAETEKAARYQASLKYFIATERVTGEQVKANPWNQSNLVSCNEYSGNRYEIEGSAGVLATET